MRVLLVVNTLPPRDLSGVGEQVLQLAAGIEALGHTVQILGRGRTGARGPKLLFPLTVIPPLLRALRKFRPHVVQVHESDGGLAALVVSVLAPLLDPHPRLVALLQVSYWREMRAVRPLRASGRILARPTPSELRFRYFKGPLYVALGCLSAWLADGVLAPSRVTADEIRQDYGIGSVRVLPNVTGAPLPSLSEDSAQVGEASGFFLYVGRLRIRKGLEVLLEALAELWQHATAGRLLVAGDGERRRVVERRVKRLNLEQAVRVLGYCSRERVRELLSGALALVVPSTYEGMPLVILEAMDAGVPVVASAVSGIPEVVEDGGSGWLVPPEDPQRLAEALAAVLEDPMEARRRGQQGRRRIEAEFRPLMAARLWAGGADLESGDRQLGGAARF